MTKTRNTSYSITIVPAFFAAVALLAMTLIFMNTSTPKVPEYCASQDGLYAEVSHRASELLSSGSETVHIGTLQDVVRAECHAN